MLHAAEFDFNVAWQTLSIFRSTILLFVFFCFFNFRSSNLPILSIALQSYDPHSNTHKYTHTQTPPCDLRYVCCIFDLNGNSIVRWSLVSVPQIVLIIEPAQLQRIRNVKCKWMALFMACLLLSASYWHYILHSWMITKNQLKIYMHRKFLFFLLLLHSSYAILCWWIDRS